MATDNLTTDRPTSSTDWAEAVHNYESARMARDEAGKAHSEAEEAAFAEAKGRDVNWLATYGIPYGMTNRDKVLEALRYYPAKAAAVAASAGTPLTDDQIDALYKSVPQIADDFLAERRAIADANQRHKTHELEAAFTAACDTYSDAFDKLMKTPAPDGDALIAKLEILTSEMVEADEQDADSVGAIRDDAKRLFGRA